jgi:thiol:disulfide interchange protein
MTTKLRLALLFFAYFFLFNTLIHTEIRADTVELQVFSSKKNITSEPFWVAVRFQIKDKWHIYNPISTRGVTGLQHKWDLPKGIEILETHWSPQKDFHQGGFTLPAFEKEAWVFVKMVCKKALDEKMPISVHFSWAACKDLCTLGEKNITFHLPLPPEFILSPEKISEHLSLKTGITTPPLFWVWAFIFAFLGGIILNLMPCVLPVLSMKLLHLMQQQNLKLHGVVFTMGVWSSFMILAGGLMLLRHFGHDMGWGFQLQWPPFVATLSLIFTLMALNLLGAFEFGYLFSRWSKGQMSNPYLSTFVNGALTCLVASPCTAPFMGAALGAAMIHPWYVGLMIFSGLSFGVSFPFLMVCMWPKAMAFLPKPGAWMVTLKQFFAFSMWATVLWLVWIFGHQTSLNQAVVLMALILFTSLCAWAWGKIPLGLFKSFVILLSLCGTMGGVYMVSKETTAEEVLVWEPYSKSLLERLKDEGHTIFVDFTAKWCITCQINKARVLQSPKIVDLFQKKKVILVRADWTQKNAAITQALKEQGRTGIPLYIVYKGTQSTSILPEILTIEDVEKALQDNDL